MTTQQTAVPSSKRRYKTLIGLLLVAAGLVLGGYVSYQAMTGPAIGTVVTSIPVSQNEKAPVELEQLDGKTISFAHPATYTVQANGQTNASSLESHTLVATGLASKLLSVNVSALPSGRLDDDASYAMRKLNPAKYSLKETKIKGEPVVIASSLTEYQQVAFWPHGGKLLTFALSGMANDTEAVTTEYMQMLESVTWL